MFNLQERWRLDALECCFSHLVVVPLIQKERNSCGGREGCIKTEGHDSSNMPASCIDGRQHQP
jgi:hypothetical protein